MNSKDEKSKDAENLIIDKRREYADTLVVELLVFSSLFTVLETLISSVEHYPSVYFFIFFLPNLVKNKTLNQWTEN